MTIEAQCMERDHGRCVRCGAPLATGWPGYSCHHRQSRSVGPDTLENRIMLCGSGTTGCHGWVHAHPKISRDEGWIISKYTKEAELPQVPCRHHQLGLVFYNRAGEVSDQAA